MNECIFKESAKLKDINSESSRITEEYCADIIAKKEEDRRIAEENKRLEHSLRIKAAHERIMLQYEQMNRLGYGRFINS